MKIIKIRDLPFVDFNVNSINSVNQRWADGAKFSYIDTARPDHGFNIVISGKIVYTDSFGRITEVTKGNVVYLPKGQRYEAEFFAGNQQRVRCVLVNFLLADADSNEICLSDGVATLCTDRDGGLLKGFQVVSGIYKTTMDRLHTKSAFLSLLQKIISACEDEDASGVEKCGEYIDRNYAERLAIPELAQMCGMSETTFRKRFRERFGMSPTAYIAVRKMQVACDLLRSSDITITEISEMLGFYDTSYFYKTMRHYIGMTPAEYRSQFRKNP